MLERNQPYTILVGSPLLWSSDLLAQLEKDDNYRLLEADDAHGIEKKIQNQSIDLVIVEETLPHLDLLNLVIKARSKDPDAPIVVVSTELQQPIESHVWRFGIDDMIHFPLTGPELVNRVKRLIKLRRLSCQVQFLKEENNRLKQLSQTDGLTGLMNRRTFNETAENEFSRTKRFHGQLGCIMGDIDDFKNVNDTYGHVTGDRMLKDIARIFKESTRSIDVAARYGGEEFVLLLPETSTAGVEFVAEKLRLGVESFNFSHDEPQNPTHLTISLGASQYPHSMVESYLDLVEIADHALYEAKRQGKNRVVLNKL